MNTGSMKQAMRSRFALVTLLAIGALGPLQALAQVPARFSWDTLSGAIAVPLIFESINGNTNPFDPAHIVTPGANFDATMAIAGYARTFALFDRSAMAAILLPMGRISGDVTVAGRTFNQSASGFGDPMLELGITVIGPPAQKNIPDVMRYEPGFTVKLLADLALPIGEYDSDQPLNIGQNRWYGRLGLPVIWQLGPWVPGRRTTLELLPAVWLFGNNTDYVGQTLETDPLFQLDAHLTRDFTEHLWGSLDAVWYNGGQASIDGVQGEKLDNLGVGLTLGYTIKENLNLTVGYKSTINDNAPGDLQMDGFMATLVFGWHPLIEGSRRLKEE
ncbi:transporter [Thiocapsa bogorovii]|uniref:transporter n=1 Tax=Thiocapsa bogorovii TaxID=521689 RepID=UPI001E321187|nr:transporter [Thiocapsa bogorovii]UHD18810.1 transporter [Thiocapsa bogorovii]